MSMFATFPYDDRVELLTDGANYTAAGTYVLSTEKVWRSDRLPMFVTGRGNTAMIRMLAEACLAIADRVGSFEKAVPEISMHFDKWREANAPYQGKAFQILIAGWSDAFGFGQFHLSSMDWLPGLEPMRLNTVWGVFYAGPVLDPAKMAEVLNEDTVQEGAASFGPGLCQLARETPMAPWDNPDVSFTSIGSHIDLTTLTRNGVETRQLMTWPDKRFRKLDASLKPTVLREQRSVTRAPLNVSPPSWVEAHQQTVAA
jgi:hypothetical protein